MALVPMGSPGALAEANVDTSQEPVARLLDSQRELFHSQIDQLQTLVVTQCRLTGANPLSQEMAAGALSIKIGKRPRDLLNPKAIKYMQSLFSIKDAIGKKETREISALCGVTVTQVREFFAGQRSRVRKLVRLSREKAARFEASKASESGASVSSDRSLHFNEEATMNSSNLLMNCEGTQVPENSGVLATVRDGQHHTLINHKTVEDGPSCSSQEQSLPNIGPEDNKLLENIFNLMRKEGTFSGQVKLLERVLQIRNSAVLHRFLVKGGTNILVTWLGEAAVEEQTTLVLVIFKVLSHLPLHKALPVQMSALLQTVNRLRFYRLSDISNRARVLLTKWSKLFVNGQSPRKPLIKSAKDAQKEIVRKQRINQLLSDESWQSKIDIPEDILALTEGSEDIRKSELKWALKMLPASSDDSSKKHAHSVASKKTKERRKVLLVEQPDCKTAGRSLQVARAVPSNQSRPISADDIQKAKMRAIFMQNKYGKADASNNENNTHRTDDNKVPPSQTGNILSTSRIPQLTVLKKVNDKRPSTFKENLPLKLETPPLSRPNSTSQEHMLEKLKSNQIQWQMPPGIKLDPLLRLGTGENSKEVEVQTQRNRREKETFYASPQDIPPNPKEPWDNEMDFDDSLTPEIPTEQPPDADTAEGTSSSRADARGITGDTAAEGGGTVLEDAQAATTATLAAASAAPANNGAPGPDLDLLAVLLKNPDLVFALTSGQGKSLSNGEMVALLDMLKEKGVGLTGLMNGLANSTKDKPNEPESTSLPSPTPPSEAARVAAWRSELPTLSTTPVLQPHVYSSRGATTLPTVVPQTVTPTTIPPMVVRSQSPGLGMPLQTRTTILSMPQLTVTINTTPQNPQAPNFLPKGPQASLLPQTPVSMYHPLQPSTIQSSVSDSILPSKHYPITANVASSIPRQETFRHNPAHLSNLPIQSALLPTRARPPPQLLAEPPFPSRNATWLPGSSNATHVGAQDQMPDPRPGQPKGLLDVPALNSQFYANQNSYNVYPKQPMPRPPVLPLQRGGRNEILDGSELETWSPEGSPMRSPDFRAGTNFMEPRRDQGRNYRAEWSRQWPPADRDRHRSGGNRRRRDRDRDRDRDRRR